MIRLTVEGFQEQLGVSADVIGVLRKLFKEPAVCFAFDLTVRCCEFPGEKSGKRITGAADAPDGETQRQGAVVDIQGAVAQSVGIPQHRSGHLRRVFLGYLLNGTVAGVQKFDVRHSEPLHGKRHGLLTAISVGFLRVGQDIDAVVVPFKAFHHKAAAVVGQHHDLAA